MADGHPARREGKTIKGILCCVRHHAMPLLRTNKRRKTKGDKAWFGRDWAEQDTTKRWLCGRQDQTTPPIMLRNRELQPTRDKKKCLPAKYQVSSIRQTEIKKLTASRSAVHLLCLVNPVDQILPKSLRCLHAVPDVYEYAVHKIPAQMIENSSS